MRRTSQSPRLATRESWRGARLLVAAGLVAAGCATDPTRWISYRPAQGATQTLSSAIEADAQEAKQLIEHSQALYQDDTLEHYVRTLLIPLAVQEATACSLKILRDPTCSAFAIPDGTVYITTGLVSQLRHHDQLTFIIAHELQHAKVDLPRAAPPLHERPQLVLVSKALSRGGLDALGANLTYVVASKGYPAEREHAADLTALQLLTRLKGDPRQALALLNGWLASTQRYESTDELMPFIESGQLEARQAALRAVIDRSPPATSPADQADHTFLNAIQPLRLENSRLNVEYGRLAHALDDLVAMLERTPHDARARSQLAEVCRLIAKDPAQRKHELRRSAWNENHFDATATEQLYWRLRAKREFELALKEDRRIPEIRRGLGFLFADLGQPQEAVEQLHAYLALAPDADDRSVVLNQIAQLELAKSPSSRAPGASVAPPIPGAPETSSSDISRR